MLLSESNPSPALQAWHRGMSFGFMAKKGYFRTAEAHREVDAMAAVGVRWVALMVTIMQESFASTRIYQDYTLTVADDELISMIGRFRDRGIRVMLKPILECQDSAWRGRISFPDGDQQIQGIVTDYWGRWFDSLRACMVHYARIAEETGAEMLCLGCEMIGTEHQTDHWRQTIGAVREIYKGAVTYNGDFRHKWKATAPWFQELDLIGQSFYVPAADGPGATVEQMVEKLKPAVELLRESAMAMGKPVYFAECGCRSRAGAATQPADSKLPGAYDGQEQANYLEAVLRSFVGEPWWAGLYWWKWDEQQQRPQYRDAAGDKGFTIAGKPAAMVMRKWYESAARP